MIQISNIIRKFFFYFNILYMIITKIPKNAKLFSQYILNNISLNVYRVKQNVIHKQYNCSKPIENSMVFIIV
jgi:hypothetical protein